MTQPAPSYMERRQQEQLQERHTRLLEIRDLGYKALVTLANEGNLTIEYYLRHEIIEGHLQVFSIDAEGDEHCELAVASGHWMAIEIGQLEA